MMKCTFSGTDRRKKKDAAGLSGGKFSRNVLLLGAFENLRRQALLRLGGKARHLPLNKK